MHFTFSLDQPLPIELADQRCVFIHADHALPILEAALEAKHNRLPDTRDGIEVRDDKGGRDHPKSFLRACKPEAGHPFAKDHRPRRTACIDRAALPGAPGSHPGATVLHRLVQIAWVTAGEVDEVGSFKDRFPAQVIGSIAVYDAYRLHLRAQLSEMLDAHVQPAIDTTIAFLAGSSRQTYHARFASVQIQAVEQITIHVFHHRQILTGANKIY